MRQIKFRGKPINKNGSIWDCEWYYGYLAPGCNSRFAISAGNIESWNDFLLYEVKPDTIGQFTGLKDKNGKEIYEGDIIKCCKGQKRKSPSDEWEDDNEYYIVEYKDGGFSGVSTWCRSIDAVEVIGNKYDNPNFEIR